MTKLRLIPDVGLAFVSLVMFILFSGSFRIYAADATGGTQPVPGNPATNQASASLQLPSELLAIKVSPADVQPKAPTVPKFDPPSNTVSFSAHPSDQEIILARCFEVQLAPLPGPEQVRENSDLAGAILEFSRKHEGPEPLVEFLNRHPDSRWRPAVLLNVGLVYRDEGMWSKTIPAWEEAWANTKASESFHLKAIADRSLGEMAMMHGRLGHYGRLQTLFDEIKNRDVRGPGAELVREAGAGLWLMQNKPEEAFRCGPLALCRLYGALLPGKPIPQEFYGFKSTEKGTDLAEIKTFADKVGLPCQLAFREKGAQVLVPCVVNWKVEHYAAITRGLQGEFISQDLTFGRDCLISEATLDQEASGYFVVREGPLPTGWRSVSIDEARHIYGKGSTGPAGGPGPGSCKSVVGGGDAGGMPSGPPGPSPAGGGSGPGGGGRGPGGGSHGGMCGMTTYNFDVASIALQLADTPVSYSPPVGYPVGFTASYNHRDTADRSNLGNLGDKWGFSWLSYIEAPSTAATTCYGPGNGQITYTGYNSSTGKFAPELMSQDVLQLVGTNSYVLTHRDGSQEIYNLADGSTPARVFRTSSIDRNGDSITFAYDSYYRMQTVTDSIGQATVISYELSTIPTNPSFYLITKVTDPFGRAATFTYNEFDQLSGITDTLGIQSGYIYGRGDFITTLTTPYGTTAFTGSDISYDRWLEATDPLGASEKIEWTNNATNFQDVNSSDSAPVAPYGFSNTYLNYRTTFYWSKKAMESYPNDKSKAFIYHFLHEQADSSIMSYVIESTKAPLENRVWYAYGGIPYSHTAGSTDQPTQVARILDDGSEQDYFYQYNALDNLTQVIDPLERETDLNYASNNIDVLQVSQKNGSGSDVLAIYTYNSQHLPLTYEDASGETTTYTYNSYGELLTVTNAKSQTTTLAYDSNGYLQSITGPMSGATTEFTYDGFGRVHTITDSDGYAVTIAYDSADRVVSVTYPDGTYNQVIYDKLDPEWTRDRLGQWSLSLFDPLRRLVLQQDPLLRKTIYERCPCGALTGIIDPQGNQTTWSLDVQSRITQKTYQDSTTVTYNYETTTSRVKSVTDGNNQTKTFTFNLDNTVSGIAYTNAVNTTASVGFIYDSVYPRITSMTDGTGTTTYSYNAITSTPILGAGRLASVAGPISSSTIGYTYDELGRVLTRSINGSANLTSLVYDALGRVTSVANPLGAFAATYINQTPRLQSLTYPNGQATNLSYYPNSSGDSTGNGDDRIQSLVNLNPSAANLSTFGYTYDSNGEIQTWSTKLDSAGSQTAILQNDAAQQLIFASIPTTVGNPSQAFSYEYDAVGNRTLEQVDNSTTSSVYGSMNQLSSQGPGGTMTFTGTVSALGTVTVAGNAASVDASGNWTAIAAVSSGSNSLALVATDLNGNVTNKTISVTATSGASRTVTYDSNGNVLNNGAGQTYAWDAENRLITITQTSGTTGFAYNGLGQRVQETLNGTVIKQWVWGQNPQPLEERNASDSVTKRFYGSLGEQIGSSSYYFTTDHLGSIREMVDSSGTTQARYAYDPYGRRTLVSGTDLADFGFTGDYFHAATGLSLTQFREYDPNLGRWLSRDPLGEYAGINLYGYVTNDPINLIDSLGLCNEWQASVGISGTLGWVLFGGGGANVGFTSTGHFFVQFQAYGGGAVGLFAGVGWAGGIAHSNTETPAGVSVTKADHYEGDVGLGPIAGGYSADIDKGSQGGGFPLPKRFKGGEGIGLLYGQGRSITTTVATGALWSGGCGH